MIWRLISTAGTPISMVFGLASPSARPTGTKSQPNLGIVGKQRRQCHCRRNRAVGDLRTDDRDADHLCNHSAWPRMGDRNGRPQIAEMISRPTMLLASGPIGCASTSPMPRIQDQPMSMVTKAMNGSTLRIT
jgi:hypothetical protein